MEKNFAALLVAVMVFTFAAVVNVFNAKTVSSRTSVTPSGGGVQDTPLLKQAAKLTKPVSSELTIQYVGSNTPQHPPAEK